MNGKDNKLKEWIEILLMMTY